MFQHLGYQALHFFTAGSKVYKPGRFYAWLRFRERCESLKASRYNVISPRDAISCMCYFTSVVRFKEKELNVCSWEEIHNIECIKEETNLSLSCYIPFLFRHAISSLKKTSKTGRNVGFKNILQFRIRYKINRTTFRWLHVIIMEFELHDRIDCIYSSRSVKICKELKKVFKYLNVMQKVWREQNPIAC